MAQQTNLEKLHFLLSHAKPDINLCVAGYQIISKVGEEEQPELMEAFIRGYRNTKTDGSFPAS